MAAIILAMVDIAIGTFDYGGVFVKTLNYKTEVGPLTSIYGLLVLIPTLAVTVRRLHDIGKSGWTLLIFPGVFYGIMTFWLALDESIDPLGTFWFTVYTAALTLIMLVISVVHAVWLSFGSQSGRNRFGENPKDSPASN